MSLYGNYINESYDTYNEEVVIENTLTDILKDIGKEVSKAALKFLKKLGILVLCYVIVVAMASIYAIFIMNKKSKIEDAIRKNPKLRKLFIELVKNFKEFMKANEFKKYHNYIVYTKDNPSSIVSPDYNYNGVYSSEGKNGAQLFFFVLEIDVLKLIKDKMKISISEIDEMIQSSPEKLIDITRFDKVYDILQEINQYYEELQSNIDKSLGSNNQSIKLYGFDPSNVVLWKESDISEIHSNAEIYCVITVDNAMENIPENLKQYVDKLVKEI